MNLRTYLICMLELIGAGIMIAPIIVGTYDALLNTKFKRIHTEILALYEAMLKCTENKDHNEGN